MEEFCLMEGDDGVKPFKSTINSTKRVFQGPPGSRCRAGWHRLTLRGEYISVERSAGNGDGNGGCIHRIL